MGDEAELAVRTGFRANIKKTSAEASLNPMMDEAESPTILKQIIDFLPDATFVIDRKGRVIAWNKAMERLTNVSAKDMVGKGDLEYSLAFYSKKRPVLIDLVNNPDPDILAKYNFVRRYGDTLISETLPNTHLYGANWYLNIACPLYDGKGEVIGAIECIRDITEQKKYEFSLKESESKYHSLFETANDAIFMLQDSAVIDCNAKALEMFGYSREQLIGKNPHVFLSPEYQPDGRSSKEKGEERITEALNGKAQLFEWRHRRSDGAPFDSDVSLNSLDFSGKRCLQAVVRDISERKMAQEALAKKEKFLADILESIQDGISILEPDLTIRHVNSVMRTWHESVSPLEGRKCFSAFHNKELPCYPCPTLRCLSSGKTEREIVPVNSGSEVKWMELLSYPMKDGETGKITGVVEFVRNITDRVIVEEALRESEEKFRLAFRASPDSVCLSRMEDGLFVDINEGFTELTGYTKEDVEGRTTLEIEIWDDPKDRERLFAELKEKGLCDKIEARFKGKDGKIRTGLISAAVINLRNVPHIISVTKDITAMKEAEEEREKLALQLIQAQKMESVGRLAGGIAHDFNNMLGVIMGRAELALARIDKETPASNDLIDIQKAAQRATELTKRLLGFARKQPMQPTVLNINDTIASMLKVMKRLIGEDIELVWLPEPDIMPIKIDPAQLDQILTNLCVNARDAIAGAGTITIETQNAHLDDEYCKDKPYIIPGRYVAVIVSDTGCGMEKEVLDNIFEPFFTTKEVGKGTGLGLATVYGIVKQNDGYINVYSEPGQGTTFKIYFPPHKGEALQTYSTPSEDLPRGGNETILLVEDEPMLLSTGTKMLQQLGYKVLSALGPVQAIEIVQSYDDKIELMITDVVMPTMNGRQLWEVISEMRPALKCLFTSGYSDIVIAQKGILLQGINFIQKPFTPSLLDRQIRKILD